jgi:hypothetical protein
MNQPEKVPSVTHDKEIKWRVTKKKAGSNDITIQIHADDQVVFNSKLQSPPCDSGMIELAKWNIDATKIEFAEHNSQEKNIAETEYRAYAPGNLICSTARLRNRGAGKRDRRFYSFSTDGVQ